MHWSAGLILHDVDSPHHVRTLGEAPGRTDAKSLPDEDVLHCFTVNYAENTLNPATTEDYTRSAASMPVTMQPRASILDVLPSLFWNWRGWDPIGSRRSHLPEAGGSGRPGFSPPRVAGRGWPKSRRIESNESRVAVRSRISLTTW